MVAEVEILSSLSKKVRSGWVVVTGCREGSEEVGEKTDR
jgi:hypothetical protein